MSSKRQKIEAEILKFRNEGNWNKLSESTANLSNKYGPSDGVVILVEAEIQLRSYFVDNPPRHENVSKARKDLAQLKSKLESAAASEVKDTIFDTMYESRILTCLLLYSQGRTAPCVELLRSINLDANKKKMSCYQLRFAAEAYAVKGLCLEQTKLKGSASTEEDILLCYDRSTEYSFKYMSMYPEQCTLNLSFGYILEQALQRGPLLYLKKGDVEGGIKKLRRILTAKETSCIHQKVARDMACVLLRGLCEENYFPPESDDFAAKNDKKMKRGRNGSASPTATFTISPLDKPFSPADSTQEAILLLLLSEAILNTDPILDMSPEYAETRKELLTDSKTLYDLLAVAVADFSQYDTFAKTIESSLKYAYDEFHLWYQYALSLVCAGNFDRSIRVLEECSRIRPDRPLPYLLSAKLCITRLGDYASGLLHSKKALQAASVTKDDEHDTEDYLSASHLCVGLSQSMLCTNGTSIEKLADYRQSAILHFSEAHNIDPHGVKPLLFLAVELALDGRIAEAVIRVKQALELQPHDLNCLHLMALLLSAEKHYNEALLVLDTAIRFYPENINLLLAKCKFQLHLGKCEDALCTCNQMTNIFVNLQEARGNQNLDAETMLERMTSDGRSITNYSIGNDLDVTDAGSVIGSTAISRFERAMSDMEPMSCDSTHPQSVTSVTSDPSVIRGHLWLLTAEVYLTLHRYEEAGQCVQEAAIFFPYSHEVLYARGRLAQCREFLSDAIAMYEACICVNPKHYKAMLQWAKIHVRQGDLEFAKKLLQDAARLRPWSQEVWLELGDVLETCGDIEGATDCITTAISVESASPIVPFTSVSRDL